MRKSFRDLFIRDERYVTPQEIHKREERNLTDLFLRKGESFLSRG